MLVIEIRSPKIPKTTGGLGAGGEKGIRRRRRIRRRTRRMRRRRKRRSCWRRSPVFVVASRIFWANSIWGGHESNLRPLSSSLQQLTEHPLHQANLQDNREHQRRRTADIYHKMPSWASSALDSSAAILCRGCTALALNFLCYGVS